MSGRGSSGLRIVDFGPTRTWFRPGSEAVVLLALDAQGGAVQARLEMFDDGRVVAATERQLRLEPGHSVREFRLLVPRVPRHGYGLRVQLQVGANSVEAHSAFEALDGWWESPRHAALTQFGSASGIAPAIGRLRRWHVNVAQFYDWMYRHYRYLPPHGTSTFTDTLGRVVSHRVVRDLVRACRRNGIASLAYGSVYGAEAEYVERHRAELLYDAAGRPLSLGGTFFITDLRPQSPWRQRLIGEYLRACRRFGFDGVHMDQYGEPHDGVAADGSPVHLERLFPGLIDEADERLRRLSPPRRVLFNCVGGWPLEQVVGSASAATYIEVWPPDTTYIALLAQIEKARRLAPGKQIVLAAYPSVIASSIEHGQPSAGAIEAMLLLTSVVIAAGAYHHAVAEHDRVIVGGYYPDAVSLPRGAAEAMRLAWQFSARYVHLLSAPGNERLPREGFALEADGRALPHSSEPSAGTVWLRPVKQDDGRIAVHLVDLLDQSSDAWDAPQRPAVVRRNWRLSVPGPARRWLFASPGANGGLAQGLGSPPVLRVPAFKRWGMLIGEKD